MTENTFSPSLPPPMSDASRAARLAGARQELLMQLVKTQKADVGLFVPGTTSFVRIQSPHPGFREGSLEQLVQVDAALENWLFVTSLLDGEPLAQANVLKGIHLLARDGRVAVRLNAHEEKDLANGFMQFARGVNDNEATHNFTAHHRETLRRLVPDAFVSPQDALKKTLQASLFHSIIPEAGCEPHIAVNNEAAVASAQAAMLGLMSPGSKVVLTAPYPEHLPKFLDAVGTNTIVCDTAGTGFKLKASNLERVARENNLGKGDWLCISTPNSAAMMPYSREELQSLADVIARTDIRCITDERHANPSEERHVSLASLTGHADKKSLPMRDAVVTITNLSQQFPLMKGADSESGLGALCTGNTEDIRIIETVIRHSSGHINDLNASLTRELIATQPAQALSIRRDETRRNARKARAVFAGINSVVEPYSPTPAFILHAADDGYFGCLELSPALCRKAGIRTSEHLQEYILAATGIVTRSLAASGVTEPMVGINVNDFADVCSHPELAMEDLFKHMAHGIHHETLPHMDHVTTLYNKKITALKNVGSGQKKQARR